MLRIAILVANKSEDIEVVVPADLWRRAGMIVRLISIEKKKNVILSTGTKISCDSTINEENLSKYNAIYLPGGDGYKFFNDDYSPKLILGLRKAFQANKAKLISICASPTIFATLGFLNDKKATCYPTMRDLLKNSYIDKNIVIDGNIITANGPATAFELGIKIIEILLNKEKAESISEETLYKLGK